MTSVEVAYEALKSAILAQELKPGERLKESELAEKLGLSRTPVREAFNRLNSEGWLVHVPNQGAKVATWGIDDIQEIFAIRLQLEPFAAGLAVSKMDEEKLSQLSYFAEEVEHYAALNTVEALQMKAVANKNFHAVLLEAAGNKRMQHILSQLIDSPLVVWTFKSFGQEETMRSIAHHFEIVRAAKSKDSQWAESIMRSHILAAKNSARKISATFQCK
ncbi:MAG: GntR family transcriptional regulator [Comamonadaceae bacterium]|nr:GntR family transcriptional regulator [Comamonadaceae bacterium]